MAVDKMSCDFRKLQVSHIRNRFTDDDKHPQTPTMKWVPRSGILKTSGKSKSKPTHKLTFKLHSQDGKYQVVDTSPTPRSYNQTPRQYYSSHVEDEEGCSFDESSQRIRGDVQTQYHRQVSRPLNGEPAKVASTRGFSPLGKTIPMTRSPRLNPGLTSPSSSYCFLPLVPFAPTPSTFLRPSSSPTCPATTFREGDYEGLRYWVKVYRTYELEGGGYSNIPTYTAVCGDAVNLIATANSEVEVLDEFKWRLVYSIAQYLRQRKSHAFPLPLNYQDVLLQDFEAALRRCPNTKVDDSGYGEVVVDFNWLDQDDRDNLDLPRPKAIREKEYPFQVTENHERKVTMNYEQGASLKCSQKACPVRDPNPTLQKLLDIEICPRSVLESTKNRIVSQPYVCCSKSLNRSINGGYRASEVDLQAYNKLTSKQKT